MSTTATSPAPRGVLTRSVDVIGALRQLLPEQEVGFIEAHEVAERQAALLLALFRIKEPPVPQVVISSLPDVVVELREGWPTSAMTVCSRSKWRIVIKAEEPHKRQRFSLAHEFKHILDDPIIDRIYAHLPVEERSARAERFCDYFAACLLMPGTWIEHDWSSGLRSLEVLVRRYHVSKEAMTTRLSELGLIPMSPALEKKLSLFAGVE